MTWQGKKIQYRLHVLFAPPPTTPHPQKVSLFFSDQYKFQVISTAYSEERKKTKRDRIVKYKSRRAHTHTHCFPFLINNEEKKLKRIKAESYVTGLRAFFFGVHHRVRMERPRCFGAFLCVKAKNQPFTSGHHRPLGSTRQEQNRTERRTNQCTNQLFVSNCIACQSLATSMPSR